MEISQHAKYTCTFCGKVNVKRTNVGIWNCRACHKVVAGGGEHYPKDWLGGSTWCMHFVQLPGRPLESSTVTDMTQLTPSLPLPPLPCDRLCAV